MTRVAAKRKRSSLFPVSVGSLDNMSLEERGQGAETKKNDISEESRVKS